MFLQYYGLKEQPFGVTPDPRFLYMGRAQEEAFSSLVYGIETGRGFMALIASPGLGKTTILLRLMAQLQNSARTAFLFQTHSTPEELLRSLLIDLDIEPKGQDLGDLQRQLGDVLIEEARAGKRLVVAIDEAQNLGDNLLEMVRTLSNFETPQAKLIQIVLVGQPQLADKLASPELEQLRQRVSIITQFPPLAAGDVPKYIDYRLRVAGYRGGELFSPAALSIIAAESKGIPRTINNLCFHALSLGFAKNIRKIDAATVREVVADLSLEPMRTPAPVAVGGNPPQPPQQEVQQDAAVAEPVTAAQFTPREAVPPSSAPQSLDDVSLSSDSPFDDVIAGTGPTMHPYGEGHGRDKGNRGSRTTALFLGLVALVGCLWGGATFRAHLGHLEQTTATHRGAATEPSPVALPSTSEEALPETRVDATGNAPAPADQRQPAATTDEQSATPAPGAKATLPALASPTGIDSPRVSNSRSAYFREVSHTPSALPEGTGRLIVESSQSGAHISVNGESNPLWVTPKMFHVAAGTYVVSVSGPGLTPWARRVHVDDGQEKLLMAELENHDGGFFTVDTNPVGMQVFIDGKAFGPSRVETVLESGWHVCEVIPGPGLQPLVRKFHLGPGESITRRIRMTSPEASLQSDVQHAGTNLAASPERGTP